MAYKKDTYKVTTYRMAFEGVLSIAIDEKIKKFIEGLEKEGHTEKSIAYSIWRTQEKLARFKGAPNFMNILRNEILKYSWSKSDPRWNEYNKRKQEEEKINAIIESRKLKEKAEKERLRIGYVYFIQGECGGAIKIGHSKDPQSRLKSLQTGYPDMLKLLYMFPGEEKVEKELHLKFSSIKLNGEWFKPEETLLKEIEALKAKYK